MTSDRITMDSIKAAREEIMGHQSKEPFIVSASPEKTKEVIKRSKKKATKKCTQKKKKNS